MARQTLEQEDPLRDCLVVSAIDFGTTYSGYAFSLLGEPDTIIINKNWGSKGGWSSMKTPTCVLTERGDDGAHTFISFGFEAEENYLGRLTGVDKDRACLFNRFKMKLHRQNPENSEAEAGAMEPLDSMTEKRGLYRADSITIFAMALEYMKNHLLEYLKEGRQSIQVKYIRWVLTVPAIWSVTAKSFMRKAAYKAGLIDTEDSNRLMFALEPEAASMHCKSLRLNNFAGEKYPGDLYMPPTTIYAIIDAGGGTVDITIHEVMEDNSVEEVCVATGGPWGGTSIDKAFNDLLIRIWGDEFIEKIKTEFPAVWFDIESHFERVKRVAGPDREEDFQMISISIKMAQIYQHMTKKDITEVDVAGVSINEDYQLVATKAAVDALFKPTVEHIVCTLEQLLSQPDNKKMSYMFLVGGLNCSRYLTEGIKEKFGQRMKILIPEDPQLAVMKGAVKFGQNPGHIRARVMQRTYGIHISEVFDSSKHPLSRKVVYDGIDMCGGLFDALVKTGERLGTGEERERIYNPPTANSTSVTITFYEAERQNVTYVDDPGVERIGSYLEVPMPDTTGGSDRPILFKIKFGTQEIEARARDDSRRNSEWVHTVFRYAAN